MIVFGWLRNTLFSRTPKYLNQVGASWFLVGLNRQCFWRRGRTDSIGNRWSAGTGLGCGVVMAEEWSLTAADRCDCRKCGARAYVRVIDPDTWRELLFCGHHFAVHEAALVRREFAVFDERGQLDVKLDASA